MSNTRFNSSRSRTTHLLSKLTSIVLIIVGFIISIPFAYVMMFGEHEPNISLGRIIAVMLVVTGLPMFLVGLVGLSARRGPETNTIGSDVSRIRFNVETQSMNDSMKGK